MASQNDRTAPIIFATYDFNLSYSINRNDEDEGEIASLSARYKINLFLTSIEEILQQEKSRIGKILGVFFNHTGRIMIYPYFRNLADILIRESNFILPPLPPLKINNNHNDD